MNRFKTVATSLAVVALLAWAALTLHAGPMLVGKGRLADEVLALANIDEVYLSVHPLPVTLAGGGATINDIESAVSRILRDAGIDVSSDDSVTPRLNVTVWPATDNAIEDVVGIVFMIDIQQRVALLRADSREMVLPTSSVMTRRIALKDDRGKALMEECRRAAKLLVQSLEYATRAAG
ncbi:MAG: hypothetical protein CMJ18_02695 [Phycisphaeraceae bacterium]|nr:hypothetical protein [Phycisphaeraceae bacterium]